ncbi:MAG TPA: Uma2 family endonuclease [Pyrinomonadaceae bacterium]|jgi:Uma2 family endonuclease|nr:Uma2 family endonuclease [Pyrinomonadaceae bacterium]
MSVQVARDTFTVHRFTVEEYRRMGEAGIFPMGARLELIEGEIVEMSPIGDRHAWCVGWLNRTLTLMLQHVALIWVQNPMRLGDSSEPQPDVLVLKPRDDFYKKGKPQPEDILLVIEVSDSTLAYDRLVKVPLYARAGVPEVWIVNLVDERVETFADPSGSAYRATHSHASGEEVQSRSLASLRLGVSEIFG